MHKLAQCSLEASNPKQASDNLKKKFIYSIFLI